MPPAAIQWRSLPTQAMNESSATRQLTISRT